MHISRVDLNLFIVFEAIFAEGSVTRASLKLNLTQPAISKRIAALEKEVGARLFLSPRTVQQPLRSVYNKLGVDNRAAATRLAVQHGLA